VCPLFLCKPEKRALSAETEMAFSGFRHLTSDFDLSVAFSIYIFLFNIYMMHFITAFSIFNNIENKSFPT